MKQYNLNGHIFSSIHKRLDFDPYVCYEGEIEIKLSKAELIALGATPIDESKECEHCFRLDLETNITSCVKCNVIKLPKSKKIEKIPDGNYRHGEALGLLVIKMNEIIDRLEE